MIAIARHAFTTEYRSWRITRIPKLDAINMFEPAIYCASRIAPTFHYDDDNCPLAYYSEFADNRAATEFIADQAWAAALRAVAPLIRENKPIG